MKNKVIIRADSSVKIGSGHIMRCLSLADELKKREVWVGFVCRDEMSNMINYIHKKGYETYHLPAGIDLQTDMELTVDFIKNKIGQPVYLLIDNYEIDYTWESYLRNYVEKIMVIDDYLNRFHNCDVFLNQNLYLEMKISYKLMIPAECHVLLGPRYALLRSEFSEMRKKIKERNGEIKNILVFFGGSDFTNETAKALKAIKLLGKPDIRVDVVVGMSNPYKEEIRSLATSMENVHYHCQIENMAELLAAANLAIGSSGSASWERCCMGLPTIIIYCAENQKDIANNLDKAGIARNLGYYENVDENKIKNEIKSFLNNRQGLKQMSLKGMDLVDGRGINRVADKLEAIFHL